MFALIDCNNFYVSCERLFRPDLRHAPVVVLSSNDGCVISRSNEAKALGIKMGEPFFRIQALVKHHGVQVFSSNFTLYGDLSDRVMRVIEETWLQVEIYSIDEAFLDLRTLPKNELDNFCLKLQQKILRHTGIPTSIGIGTSKTLAKLANFVAKNKSYVPVFNLTQQSHWLQHIDVTEVWGIGRQWGHQLKAQGIQTAADLATLSALQMKKQYNVMMMRVVLELKGITCGGIEESAPKQTIVSSKSFGQMQTEYGMLAQAISNHCARACEKARAHNLVAERVYVFVRSNYFREDLPQYTRGLACQLAYPTNDTRHIIHIAKQSLKKIFKPGIFYKKAGVRLEALASNVMNQQDLFHPLSEESQERSERLMSVFDRINARFGQHTIRLAAQGYNHMWKARSEMRSPCYTTCWSELPIVLCR